MQFAYAPVKVKRVWCSEGVSEKECHLVERIGPIRHNEIGGFTIFGSANAIADVGKVALRQKTGMQFAVYYKHWTGLAGVDTAWSGLLKSQGFNDPNGAGRDTQDPVR